MVRSKISVKGATMAALLLAAIMLHAVCCYAMARKHVSDRARKVYEPDKPKVEQRWKRTGEAVTPLSADTLLLDSVIYRGFDKPSSADRESFIISNLSSRQLIGISMEISYFTTDGELLHRRTIDRQIDIPPRESRKFDVRSFDRNHSFYYHLSNPGRGNAAPFKASIHTIALYFSRRK